MFRNRRDRAPDYGLLLILLFAAVLRLQYLTLPFAEAHRWRSITNVDIARNFAERSMNLFYPQVSWGGPTHPFVGMEFPLLQWSLAALYVVFGEHPVLARLLSIAFSIGTLWAVYALGRYMFNAATGRAAAFLLAISPSAVFFGRIFLSDTPMVFFSVLGVLGWVRYLDTGKMRDAIFGSVATALAALVKIPAIMILVPIAWAAWEAKRWRALTDRPLITGNLIALAATAAWYWHADVIFHQTGLGEAIWHPSGTYPAAIAVAAGQFVGISHWSTFTQLADPGFYREMLGRIWGIHLTPVGLTFALLASLTLWQRPRQRILIAWLGIVFVFILVTAEGNRHHEFHQLPLLPPGALLFGLIAAPAFDPNWLRTLGRGRLVLACGVIAIGLSGWLTFYQSDVVDRFFRPNGLDNGPIQAGAAIEAATAPNDSIVTVEYDQFGNNSPILLYWAHRRGWSFDFLSITPHVVERLAEEFGAAYFTTTNWPGLADRQPVLADFLKTRYQVTLPGAPRDTVLFDLRRPATPIS